MESAEPPRNPSPRDAAAAASARARTLAASIAVVVGVVLLGAKFWAYFVTDSQTVFADAMESIVNVVASVAALFAIRFASRPADENHPYGHGKIEFVTSGFEGGLIAFAGLAIVFTSAEALLGGHRVRELNLGMAVVAVAGVANLLLGLYLVRTGTRHDSPALVADGKHVMSDFWTSAGAVIGLLLVQITDIMWIDPVVAILVALLLFRTGAGLVRESARGLLDEEDPELIRDLAHAMESERVSGIIEVHQVRAISVGGFRHVDAHTVVPEFWTVERAHAVIDAYEQRVLSHATVPGEMVFHTDPCERAYCRHCDWPDCPVRRDDFAEPRPFTAESIVRGPAPAAGRSVHGTESPGPK